jgi:hypothetical protein
VEGPEAGESRGGATGGQSPPSPRSSSPGGSRSSSSSGSARGRNGASGTVPAPAAEILSAREAELGIGGDAEPVEREAGLEAALGAIDDAEESAEAPPDPAAAQRAAVELVEMACQLASGGAAGLDRGMRDVLETFAGSLRGVEQLASPRVAAIAFAAIAALAVAQARRQRPRPEPRSAARSPGAPSTITPGAPGARPPELGEFPSVERARA